ncbi:nuclear transport factor 2 family protein [Flavihumibacter sp. R14]|nr:nuclear transport factor 2 family protein [Flavihumibacter soli]
MLVKFKFTTLFICCFLACKGVLAQNTQETEIRRIENAEREAILNADTTALLRMMSPKIVVHNPENKIVGLREVINRVKQGKIDYEKFERLIERVTFNNNTAIVMGKEIIKPKGSTSNAGKTVTRRFTNIWLKENNRWWLIARQSTIISID